MWLSGEGGHFGKADGVVVERGAEGGAAAELPEAAEEPVGRRGIACRDWGAECGLA